MFSIRRFNERYTLCGAIRDMTQARQVETFRFKTRFIMTTFCG